MLWSNAHVPVENPLAEKKRGHLVMDNFRLFTIFAVLTKFN
jgi:hypothetical protein